jgi:hypothetical protein
MSQMYIWTYEGMMNIQGYCEKNNKKFNFYVKTDFCQDISPWYILILQTEYSSSLTVINLLR